MKLTASWYARISGSVQWADGERESIPKAMDNLATKIDHIIGREELNTLECGKTVLG